VTNPARRIENWTARLSPEDIARVLARKQATMQRNYIAAMERYAPLEQKTREILNSAGVQTIIYLPYFNFSRQLYKLSREQSISGPSFALAAQVLLEKWTARGLDPAILARIRSEVYDIPAPAE
jgi:hypothetical protein